MKRMAHVSACAVFLFAQATFQPACHKQAPVQGSIPPTDSAPSTNAIPTVGSLKKVEPEILRYFQDHKAQVVLIEFDSRRINAIAAKYRSQHHLPVDDATVRKMKNREYANVQARVAPILEKLGIQVLRRFKNLPLITARLTTVDQLRLLAEHKDVVRVHENRIVKRILYQDQILIGQPEAENAGMTGAGTAIVVADTGVDCSNLGVGACTLGQLGGCCNVVINEDLAPVDNCDNPDHGTEVTRAAVRTAPGTQVISLDIEADVGFLFPQCGSDAAAMAAAVDRAIQEKARFNVVAINLSWAETGESYTVDTCPTSLNTAFNEAQLSGIMPIVGSGNDGLKGGVSWPACSPFAVSVASVYSSTDKMTTFSTIGKNLGLLAPGDMGTSIAAPHVSGAWAILRAARPDMSLQDTLAKFKATGKMIQDPSTSLSFPRIQIDAALDLRPVVRGLAETGDLFGGSLATGDFNGDGKADLAIGVPNQKIDDAERAGAVNVLYGAESQRNQLIHVANLILFGQPEFDGAFGSSMISCDFDGDGYADVAIGAPRGGSYRGSAYVVYGGTDGLGSKWTTNLNSIVSDVASGDAFGTSLACGDFNKDGKDDLAIGSPNKGSGAVYVLHGSAIGLTADGGQVWRERDVGLGEDARPGDGFGASLVAGDFNGDGVADLAVGAPGRTISVGGEDRLGAGMVAVLFGGSQGVTGQGVQRLDQRNIEAGYRPPQPNARLGEALAAGDFNGDGIDDLAVGAPNWTCGNVNVGHVYALYGSATGFSGTRVTHLAHEAAGYICGTLPGNASSFDFFGKSLAAGDFDGNGIADLAVGVPGSNQAAGVVEVIYGASQGLDYHYRHQSWYQGSGAIPLNGISSGNVGGTAEAMDRFGTALASADFNADGRRDLAIGVPYDRAVVQGPSGPPNCQQEPADVKYGVGVVHVIYGSSAGLYHVHPFASGCSPEPCTPPDVGPVPIGARESRMLEQGK